MISNSGRRGRGVYRIYSVLYGIVLFFLLLFEYLKRPKAKRARWLKEKFGFIEPSNKPTIWVHAVSVGEVNASVPFVRMLKERFPSRDIVVSTITDTGQDIASKKLSDIAKILYLPFDISSILRRAALRTRPVIFISVETEIWPNIFRVMRASGSTIAIVNGRISEDSFNGYRKIRFFLKNVFANVDIFCMQDNLYAGRITEIGADPKKVLVTGNFKFDIGSEPKEWGISFSGTTIIAGSTHRGEESLILDTYMRLKEEFPSLCLILAPRHPERFDEVYNLCTSKGVYVIRRSDYKGGAIPAGSVFLLDVMGELFSAYSSADIAVMGGSFIKHGGQNPLEPAFWEKPILCGPHMENFPFVEEFFKEGGAISVKTEDELYESLMTLIKDPSKRVSIGKRAKELSMKNSGAIKKTIDALSNYIKNGDI